MIQNNIIILRGYFDEMINQKQWDLIPKYFSRKFIGHGTPYVGMGVMTDDSSGIKVSIRAVFPGSPAAGKLFVKDEIIRVFDGERTYETFEELRESLWGQGVLGTSITIWIRRDNKEHEITLQRGLVQSFEYSYDLLESGFREFYKDWPDLKTRLVNAIESGDLVAYYVENQGTNTRYGCSALWAEFGFVRIQDGKITDWWSVEDTFSQLKQLGYIVHEPVLKK